MSEFTEGDWKLQGDLVLSQGAETVICQLSEMYTLHAVHQELLINSPHGREAMANGRLIAAAPKLYEALQRIVASGWLMETPTSLQREAQAALDAAEGAEGAEGA